MRATWSCAEIGLNSEPGAGVVSQQFLGESWACGAGV
jgi:hypothetical protein